jgi:Tfp pilus assembly PilM family ATPase
MPPTHNVLAIEWERREARYVWASVSGKRLQVRALGRVAATEGETPDSSDPLETMLVEIKGKLRLKNPQVLFLLPRAECEEFEASLPPADDHEVAQFVMNQAHERWPTVSDDAVIDYYSLEDSLEGTARVSIVLLTAEKQKQYEALCKQVGWKLAGIHLRHLGTVQLWRRLTNPEPQALSVLLSLSRTDADLIVFTGQTISLVRTIPVSTEVEPAVLAEKLKLEVQRSLLVTTRPATPEESVQPAVFLFGSKAEQGAFADKLRETLDFPVSLLDPLSDLARSIPKTTDQVHQFAPLLGLLTESAKADTVNFLKPKCRVSVSPLYRRVAIYAVAVVAVLGFLIWSGYDEVSQLRNKTQELKKQLTQTQKKVDDMTERTAVVDYFQEWQRDDINWLEELRELSSRFPQRAETQVKTMTLSVGSNRRGVISMNLRAKNDQVISRLEQTIRDSFHQIRTNQLSQNSADTEYPWQFGASILVTRRTRDELVAAWKPPVSTVETSSETRVETGSNSLKDGRGGGNAPVVQEGSTSVEEPAPGESPEAQGGLR